ncbi:unnamed protein product, partial [Urochloa humidicola]
CFVYGPSSCSQAKRRRKQSLYESLRGVAGDKDLLHAEGICLPRRFAPSSPADNYGTTCCAATPPRSRSASAVGGRVAAAVHGPVGPVRRTEASSFSAEPLALSPAQEALIAIIDAEGTLHRRGREGEKGPRRVICLLLVEADRFQEVTGRGVLETVALEAGAVVRVMPWEEAGSPPQGSHPRRSWRENNATHDHVIFRL